MDSENRFALVMKLVDEQSPALFAADGLIYEGRMESCWRGEVVAVARLYGTDEPRVRHRWRLEDIEVTEFSVAAEEPAEEDPLMTHARELRERADEYNSMSLAEQLLVNRIPPRGSHDRCHTGTDEQS